MDRKTEDRLLEEFLTSSGVCTDTRKLVPGQIFFALKGENFDGNRFAEKALETGAKMAVVSADSGIGATETDGRYLVVEDTLTALQSLARRYRSRFRIPVIALTGTNGKTTTKELLCSVLSAKYRVTATVGNLNNHIGVPLTLLQITPETEIAVVEMGANHPGEIALLCSIALPDHGLITNVGKAHLEGFGSFEGVKRAKGELYDYLQRTADTAFLNMDDAELCGMAMLRPDLKTVRYGVSASGSELLPVSESEPFLRLSTSEYGTVATHLVGNYNAANVMAALCVGKYFGVPNEDAAKAVENYVPSNLRSQLEKTERNLLILDTYNANPSSMRAAIGNFRASAFHSKVMILGDMLELGSESHFEHSQILELAREAQPELAVFVGTEFAAAGKGLYDPKCLFFRDVKEAGQWLAQNPLSGKTILVKGSNGIRLPELKEYL